MEGLTLDRDMFAKGMGMVFHGLGLVFDSIGAPGGESLADAGTDAGQERADKEKAAKPAARKRAKAKEEPAAEAKEEPAAEAKEEPAGETKPKEEPPAEAKEPIQETEKTEAGKTDGAPSADAPLLTYEQVVNIITKRVNRAQAEGDTGFNEKLKGIITQMGFSKVSEMPADRYEEFMTLLAFL